MNAMGIVERIDRVLNDVTMYKLLVYSLGGLLALALCFSFIGVLPLSPLGIAGTLTVVLAVGFVTNLGLHKLYGSNANLESGLITALILACILPPSTSITDLIGAGVAIVLATASKFLLTYRHQHIINPAAAGAIFVSLLGLTHATWWIGNPTMLPFVLLASMAIWRKLRYWHLAWSFGLVALATLLLVGAGHGNAPAETLQTAFNSWPLVFFAGFMLTEPSTMPVGKRRQSWYAAFVGLIFGAQLSFGPIDTTPEIALAAGNILFFALAPKARTWMRLKARHHVTDDIEDLEFTPEQPLDHRPGQYMEWTMPYTWADDLRGNRRTFTVASSPTEQIVHLGLRYYQPSSSFKQHLRALPIGGRIAAGQVSGDFILPADKRRPVVFIAGGVGITPFRSMARYMIDTKSKRHGRLYYLVRDKSEVMYADTWEQAAGHGLQTTIVTPTDKPFAELSTEQLRQDVPDLTKPMYYVSGPNIMVRLIRRQLRQAGVPRKNIITDYFSGY